jgi:hypothetical protein
MGPGVMGGSEVGPDDRMGGLDGGNIMEAGMGNLGTSSVASYSHTRLAQAKRRIQSSADVLSAVTHLVVFGIRVLPCRACFDGGR